MSTVRKSSSHLNTVFLQRTAVTTFLQALAAEPREGKRINYNGTGGVKKRAFINSWRDSFDWVGCNEEEWVTFCGVDNDVI